MKYLKIDNNKGFYWDGNEYQEIDKINKESLLVLLNAAETEDFEIDPYNEDLLANKAHQVIYENIYSKFNEFLNDKEQFKTEVDSLYKEAINKYGVDESEDFDEEVEEIRDDEEFGKSSADDLPF